MFVYGELQTAFEYYNLKLFANVLPDCLITLQRQKKVTGYFSAERFASDTQKEYLHEIAMNPEYFKTVGIERTLSTLVHEMCHLDCFMQGLHGRGGYHNKAWARIMESKGLIPSTTGKPGGKQTGDAVTHYIDPTGLFKKYTNELLGEKFVISWYDRFYSGTLNIEEFKKQNVRLLNETGHAFQDDQRIKAIIESGNGEMVMKIQKPSKSGMKYKYSCDCSSVWGKDGLSFTCNKCKREMTQEK